MDTNTCVSKFICSRREQNNYSTHVSMIKPLGNFNIERSDLEQFWKLYCDELQTNGNKFICGLAEKNNKDTKYIPVLNDTDIKLTLNDSNKNSKKLYTDNHIREVIKTYQKYLKNYIIDYKPIYGICFVLEKPNPTILIDKNKISHGFHLHFPYTFMSKVDQEILLLPNIKNELIDKKIFEDIGATTSECIDNATNKCWLMYGGRKEVNKQTYKLSKIYDDNLNEITLAEALKDYTLTNTFGEVINFVDSHEYYLPRILSIDCENKNVVQTKDNIEIVIKQQLKKATELKRKDLDVPITDTLKKAREFLKLIKSERADNYDDWLDIGITLYCIGDGCSEALDMWLDFSKKTSKINYYSEKYCVYTWNHFENRGKGIGSLANYAKQDDPEKYEKIKKESTERLTKEIINGGHYDLALLLKNKFGDDFKCYDDTKGHWFRYENHRWKYDQNGLRLKKKIPVLLVKEFIKKRGELLKEINDSEEIDLNNHKGIKNINKIIANLKSMPFINCIMKACQMIFYDEEFVEKLDTDPYLLHFSNGILDLRTRKLRDGRPEDFISLTTGYDFKQYSYDDPDIIMVNEHLNKIFPDPELKQYFLEYCAMLLKGGNKSKTFLVLSGHGDNGKSINMELLKLVLGKYMRILPTTVLTGKKAQSSQATPELDGINGVRHVLVQEPEGKETMNIGTLKELTGNDEIYIRGLFKEGRNILPLFKLSMTCNALPRLPFDDPATWNRIRVLFHESTFPKDASLVPAEENEQYIKKIFPRDDFFSEKLPKMKQPMMWLMFDILGKIEKFGRMKEPEKVKKATLMYRENNDVFYQFIKEKIVEDHTENCGITLIEAFTAFREWFKNSFPNVSIPDKNDMKKDLLLKWGEIDKKTRKWLNYRLREDKDDLRDGTLIILNEQDLQQDNKIPEFKPVEYEELKLVDNDNDSYIILEEDKPITKFKKINRLNKYIIPENEIEFEIESDSDSDIDIDTSPLKIYTHKHPQQNKFERENTSDNESESENTSDDETTLEITDESDSDTDSE
jgi:P4 family phage/plasmid primase-like protien